MSLSNIITELKATTKPKEKQEILKKYDSEFFRWLIYVTYDPFILFNIKLNESELPEPGTSTIEAMVNTVVNVINFCANSKSPKQNREKVVDVLSYLDKGGQDLLIGVLSKNWKCGVGKRNALKVYPKAFSTFEVQLANVYNHEKDYKINEWLYTPKLDGVRGIALRVNDEWKVYTRKGKEVLTVDHIKESLEKVYEDTGYTFFDGELYKHGIDFNIIQGWVTRFTSGTAHDLEYHVFACGDAQAFFDQDFSGITMTLKATDNYKNIERVQSYSIATGYIDTALDREFKNGYEGIMLRPKDCKYDFKRSNQLLKLKSDGGETGETISDCVVKDVIIDKFPVIQLGTMVELNLVTKLTVIQEDGIECTVGSGFDLPFRRYYKNNKDELIGKVVEIKYQGYGSKGRMRFPRLHKIREDL